MFANLPKPGEEHKKIAPTLKISLIGDRGAGQMEIFSQYFYGNPDRHRSADSVLRSSITKSIHDNDVTLQLWPFIEIGLDKIRYHRTNEHTTGTHAFLVIYDVTRTDSLQHALKLIDIINSCGKSSGNFPLIYLVHTTSKERVSKQAVDYESVSDMLDKDKVKFCECSITDSHSVDKLFTNVATMIMLQINENIAQDHKAKTNKVQDDIQKRSPEISFKAFKDLVNDIIKEMRAGVTKLTFGINDKADGIKHALDRLVKINDRIRDWQTIDVLSFSNAKIDGQISLKEAFEKSRIIGASKAFDKFIDRALEIEASANGLDLKQMVSNKPKS